VVLPNVLVVGAQKCGTTAVYELLRSHPSCAVCRSTKEVDFFVSESPYPFGTWHMGLEWYESLFDHASVVADVSPSYAGWPVFPSVAERASGVVPGAMIVYLVRDPIDRMISHWRHFTMRGYETRTVDDALTERSPQNLYLAMSRYGSQLDRWIDRFPSDRVLVLHQEEVRQGARRLWDTLGLPAIPALAQPANASNDLRRPTALARRLPERVHRALPLRLRSTRIPAPVLHDDTLRCLRELLASDIVHFQRVSGVQLVDWIE
jgi:hypothetical protein